ncbi:hypothetical protein CW733_10925 [Lacinutrix sp. Bg11-31]|nr:hypothetical protein CW733_10925 [Lacinutrix sp. Bg11-31]
MSHGSGGREDVNKTFTAVNSGSIFFAFDLSVTDTAPISGTDSEYFAHFNTGTFAARTDIVPPTGSGDFSVGISAFSSTATSTWPSDLTFNTTYKIVIEYNFATSAVLLWVDPVNVSSTSISGGSGIATSIDAIAFRQSNSSSDETITIDNVRVSTVFDDATLSNQNNLEVTNFKIYPNPVSNGFVNIKTSNNATTTVSVYNVLGKQVINTVLKSDRLNVSNLNAGVYILKLSQNGATTTKKLVIK